MNESNPNWAEVINEICKHLTQKELAERIGSEQQHISRAKKTDNINYRLGYALMQEYKKIKSEHA